MMREIEAIPGVPFHAVTFDQLGEVSDCDTLTFTSPYEGFPVVN